MRRLAICIGCQDSSGFNAFKLQHFSCHVEIHDITGVIAVHEQNPGPAVHRQCGIDDRLRRWRGEHVAGHRGIGQTLADETEKGGLVA